MLRYAIVRSFSLLLFTVSSGFLDFTFHLETAYSLMDQPVIPSE